MMSTSVNSIYRNDFACVDALFVFAVLTVLFSLLIKRAIIINIEL